MSILNKLFKVKEPVITSYSDFWSWFKLHEKNFFNVVKNNHGVEKFFFDKMSAKLNELKDGFCFLTGIDEQTVELFNQN